MVCVLRVDGLPYAYIFRENVKKRNFITVDSGHCFDVSGLISAVGLIDIYTRQYVSRRIFCLWFVTIHKNPQKPSLPNPFAGEKARDMVGAMSAHTAQKTVGVSSKVTIYNINVEAQS